MKKILALSVNPPSHATTRLRVQQFQPYFNELGIDIALWTFIGDRDLDDWYFGGLIARLQVVVKGALRMLRLPWLLRRTDAVLVQREALPFGPPVIEMAASRMRPLIWDVDDSIWETGTGYFFESAPAWLRRPAGKYRKICEAANQVWAATDTLAAWCRDHSRSVHVVPTVVEVPAEEPTRPYSRVAGWIGSPSTSPFLCAILPALERVDPPVDLIVVGADTLPAQRFSVRSERWSLAAENHALAEMCVGLYPIDRGHPLAEGKSGLKAILFMAHGIPPVVTPTRTNASIVRDGIEGLHAATPKDFTVQVQRLLGDRELWERCRHASYLRARDFSAQQWGPRVAMLARAALTQTDAVIEEGAAVPTASNCADGRPSA